jgi:hypothetical protein
MWYEEMSIDRKSMLEDDLVVFGGRMEEKA